ncbi:YggT family protein [Candidatus Williamhamiltonella defendens]|uniref:YggT family protein n=1 Tax=Candidatus Williamhamiltonella defendens TaxID=138072 RepID=UPI00130DFAAB|nr:YggT family protein [Candidatus Hamiltonella defensa]
MLTLTFFATTLIDIYVMILLLRIWMRWVKCDFYNPFSQFIVKMTHPIVNPIQSILPSAKKIEAAAFFISFFLMALKYPLLLFIQGGVIVLNQYNLLFGVVSLLKVIGYLVFWIIIIRAITSWISQGSSPMDDLLDELTEPLMSPIRRFLPAMGSIDFSGMLLILILYLMNYLGMDLLGDLWLIL